MVGKAPRACLALFCTLVFSPLFLTEAHAAGCTITCQLTTDTNVLPSDATVWVLVDNTNYTTLPNIFSFPKGTIHTIQVLNQTLIAPSGARYVWKQWSLSISGNLYTTSATLTTPPIVVNYTTGQNGKFIAEYQKQFQLTLLFTDASGQPVAPPSSVTLQSGASRVIDSSFSGQWLDAKVWNVVNATWQGNPNTESGTASFNLSAGPVKGTLRMKAYMATIQVVDKSENPLPDATITVTFANETVKTFTSDNHGKVFLGHIPLGPYSVQVKYRGQDMGNWTANASANPTLTTVLNVSGPPPPIQLPNPLTLVRTYWSLAVGGFVAGFIVMGVTARLSGRKTMYAKPEALSV